MTRKNAYADHPKKENRIFVMNVMKYVLVEKIIMNIIWKKSRINQLQPTTILAIGQPAKLVQS